MYKTDVIAKNATTAPPSGKMWEGKIVHSYSTAAAKAVNYTD